MPVMGGEEAFGKIREIRSDIPILVVSGYTEEKTGNEMMGLQNTAFLQKPFMPSDLLRTIRSMLDPDNCL